METVPYSGLPESYGTDGIKGRISEAIEKSAAFNEKLVLMPDPSVPSKEKIKLILEAIENISAARNEFHSLSTKEKEYHCFDDPSILKNLAYAEEILLMFLNAFLGRNPSQLMFLIDYWKIFSFSFPETRKQRKANKRWEREANKRRSTLRQIEFVEAKKNTALPCYAVAIQTHTAPAPGAPCDDGNCVPPSTQMPEALPSNDPAPVGGSSDDDPNGIESRSDESSRSTEASPAHPPDITTSSNGASPPVREDDSERREPPVPRDIESQRDGNRNSEAIPKEVLLMFALQAFQILSNVKSNGISLLSRRAEIVQYCAEALTVIGFFCGLGIILVRNDRNLRAATNIMSRIGFYFTGLGLIATLCVPLGKFMFWILGLFCFLFSAIYAYALWKGWIV